MKEKKIILETKALSIGYSKKTTSKVVASNMNLRLFQGELVAVIGANGVGKSTLLRTLSRVQNPLSGIVTINEQPLERYSSLELAAQLSLVLADPISSSTLTVAELVTLGRQPYTNWIGTLTDVDREKIDQALAQMQIQDLAHKKCYELSDGQLQKALIARAIAQDTPLIVLDEPTTHLDMYHKTYVLQLMKQLIHKTQKTLLFSTHEIDLAIQLCDKILIMTPSELHYGTPEELIENGCFSTLFPKDLIDFDVESRRFRMRK